MMFHPTSWFSWASTCAYGWARSWSALLGGHARDALYWASSHTGLPVVLVAAIALVLSWRMFKRSLRFAVEVALVSAVLLVATELGLLRW
jgi:hypothetical protein